MCFHSNGVTTEVPPPGTRLGINGFARNVLSLKVTPTRDTSLDKWVCPQFVFLEAELLQLTCFAIPALGPSLTQCV